MHYGPWINFTFDSNERFPFKDKRIKVAKRNSDSSKPRIRPRRNSPRNPVFPKHPKSHISHLDEFQGQHSFLAPSAMTVSQLTFQIPRVFFLLLQYQSFEVGDTHECLSTLQNILTKMPGGLVTYREVGNLLPTATCWLLRMQSIILNAAMCHEQSTLVLVTRMPSSTRD